MSLLKEEINKLKWVFASEKRPLSRRVVHQLIPFAGTCLCEAGFLSYAATETKYGNRLHAVSHLRIQLSNMKPNIKGICEATREKNHSSH
jgi:hypothetical protein